MATPTPTSSTPNPYSSIMDTLLQDFTLFLDDSIEAGHISESNKPIFIQKFNAFPNYEGKRDYFALVSKKVEALKEQKKSILNYFYAKDVEEIVEANKKKFPQNLQALVEYLSYCKYYGIAIDSEVIALIDELDKQIQSPEVYEAELNKKILDLGANKLPVVRTGPVSPNFNQPLSEEAVRLMASPKPNSPRVFNRNSLTNSAQPATNGQSAGQQSNQPTSTNYPPAPANKAFVRPSSPADSNQPRQSPQPTNFQPAPQPRRQGVQQQVSTSTRMSTPPNLPVSQFQSPARSPIAPNQQRAQPNPGRNYTAPRTKSPTSGTKQIKGLGDLLN